MKMQSEDEQFLSAEYLSPYSENAIDKSFLPEKAKL